MFEFLSCPNPDESLLPEIATTYKNNRCLYDTNAELYTSMYATEDQVSLDEPRVWLGSRNYRLG